MSEKLNKYNEINKNKTIFSNSSPKFSYEGIYERVEFLEKVLDKLKQKITSLLVQYQINTNSVIIKFLLLFFSESFFEFKIKSNRKIK